MQPIGESELIITPKGTIYHLDLAPEQLADIVITVGDPGRVGAVSKYFDRIEHKAQHREFITHTGYFEGKRISVVSTGIGTDNIDIVLNEFDALVNIDFNTRTVKEKTKSLSIIRLGTCGSLQPDVPVDSFVVSTSAIGLDNLMLYYPNVHNEQEQLLLEAFEQHMGFGSKIKPYISNASAHLLSLFSHGYIHGITATCPGFFGPQGRQLRAGISYSSLADHLGTFKTGEQRILNFEMETSALYGLGKLLGHDVISISSVINNRAQKTFSRNMSAAVDKMIRQSLEIIKTI